MSPLLLVLAISVVIGLVMVVAFRYTSDQKAIAQAKDQLKAHLLAVRLFQDQLPVVMRAYGRIFRGTGRYLRLAFLPFLISLLPITFLIIQMDRYLGSTGLNTSQPFLVEVHADDADAANAFQLQLPAGLENSAPAVHIPKDNAVVWRLIAQREGRYDIGIASSRETVSKQVVVAPGLVRVSPVRLRGELLGTIAEFGRVGVARWKRDSIDRGELSDTQHRCCRLAVELDRFIFCGVADCWFHF